MSLARLWGWMEALSASREVRHQRVAGTVRSPGMAGWMALWELAG
ncbi:hypothetical protein [Craurococcus roseus]